jgi:hypothetical protein
MPQNKEICFVFLNSLRYLLPIQNYMKHCQLIKSLDPIADFVPRQRVECLVDINVTVSFPSSFLNLGEF